MSLANQLAAARGAESDLRKGASNNQALTEQPRLEESRLRRARELVNLTEAQMQGLEERLRESNWSKAAWMLAGAIIGALLGVLFSELYALAFGGDRGAESRHDATTAATSTTGGAETPDCSTNDPKVPTLCRIVLDIPLHPSADLFTESIRVEIVRVYVTNEVDGSVREGTGGALRTFDSMGVGDTLVFGDSCQYSLTLVGVISPRESATFNLESISSPTGSPPTCSD